jgi:hypothetical protein
MMNAETLTVLSYGIGQDSWAIMVKLANDAAFRAKYAPGRLVIVSAATGNEHADTMEHLAYTREFCEKNGMEFHYLDASRGYHRGDWVSLQSFYDAKQAIGSVAYPKTCTDNLKVQPIYRWLNEWVQKNYYPGQINLLERKGAMKQFALDHGRIRVLVGIAKGEEKRVAKPGADRTKWMGLSTVREYPLIAEGMDREACQLYVESQGEPVPPPSNCVMCPFKAPIELLWTARRYPLEYAGWVKREQVKIAANADKCAAKGQANLGVYGKKLLPQVLAEAEKLYGHMTMEQLDEYRFSHGHCVSSAY